METKETTVLPKFAHEDLIREENINFDDLPHSITKKIHGFKIMSGKSKNNPDITLKMVAFSVEIADSIQDWIERNLQENTEKENDMKKEKEKAANAEKEAAAKSKKDKETKIEKAEDGDTGKTSVKKGDGGFYGRIFGR